MKLDATTMSAPLNYSHRFQSQTAVAAYDGCEYGAGSYATHAWQWQRPVLERLVKDFCQAQPRPVRLLDFACGTGRVLTSLEPLVDFADGVDISEPMLAVAREKCRQSRLLAGDILAQPELLQKEYDLISCFRFLLNVKPDLRRRVLLRLRQVLRPGGRLLVNVHGNSHSLRHPAIVWRRRREPRKNSGDMLNEMSPAETIKLLAECGFEVVELQGFGLLPPTVYRTPLRIPAGYLDRALAGAHWWSGWSIDLLFVCRPS